MERKFIFIINPKAGTKNKKALLALIEKKANEQKANFEIQNSSETGDYTYLINLIENEGVTDIVVCGGDGTVNAVAYSLLNIAVNIGIIPMGSGNGLSRTAGIPMQSTKAIDLLWKGTAQLVDGFLVNNRFSCMLSGLGFDGAVAHRFAKQTRRGLWTYAQQSIVEFFKAQPYLFEIKYKNFKFFTDAFFISIANSNQFGNNVTIAPKASLSDGLIDVVIVQKMSKAKLPFVVWNQLRGNNELSEIIDELSNKNVVYFQTSELEIHNTKLAPLHIDGEAVETSEFFKIKVIEKAFRLIMP